MSKTDTDPMGTTIQGPYAPKVEATTVKVQVDTEPLPHARRIETTQKMDPMRQPAMGKEAGALLESAPRPKAGDDNKFDLEKALAALREAPRAPFRPVESSESDGEDEAYFHAGPRFVPRGHEVASEPGVVVNPSVLEPRRKKNENAGAETVFSLRAEGKRRTRLIVACTLGLGLLIAGAAVLTLRPNEAARTATPASSSAGREAPPAAPVAVPTSRIEPPAPRTTSSAPAPQEASGAPAVSLSAPRSPLVPASKGVRAMQTEPHPIQPPAQPKRSKDDVGREY